MYENKMPMLLNKFDYNKFQVRNGMIKIKNIVYFHIISDKRRTKKQKEFLRWNKKHFSSFLKGFQLPKIVSDLRPPLKQKCALFCTINSNNFRDITFEKVQYMDVEI